MRPLNNPHGLNARHRRINKTHIRRFERFMGKSKLDNALVVTGSDEVVDLYSEAIRSRRIGFMALIWRRSCRKLSEGFYCIGNLLFKAGSLGL